MSTVNLMDSTLPEMWANASYEQDSFSISKHHCDKMMYVCFTGVTNFLAAMKSREYPMAFKFVMPNSEFLAAAIIQYIPSEDGPGHWNYTWTFDAEDIPDDARVSSIDNPMTWQYFRAVGGKKYGIAFDGGSEGICMVRLVHSINQWLEDNASETEEMAIVLDGIFQARVAVEGGEKVKALEIIGETKAIIKDDSVSEM